MRICTRCGSSRLKFLDKHVWAGVRMERYKCQDCGQIQADDVRPRSQKQPADEQPGEFDADAYGNKDITEDLGY